MRKKRLTVYPLPGEVKAYDRTILKILEQIKKQQYTRGQTIRWISKTFHCGIEYAGGSRSMLLRLGLIKNRSNIDTLTKLSNDYLLSNDPSQIVQRFMLSFYGISGIIEILENAKTPLTKEEIQSKYILLLHRKRVALKWKNSSIGIQLWNTLYYLYGFKVIDVIDNRVFLTKK